MIRTLAYAFALFIFCINARADFDDGVMAHLKGDYATALQTMLPLAQGTNHPLAQYYLGVMYANGQGVKQDPAEAGRWFDAAAKQGIASAQYRLGDMYANGKGVPQDAERAYAWLSVASHLGHLKATERLKQYAASLSEKDLQGAKSLADDYVKKFGTAPSASEAGPKAPQ